MTATLDTPIPSRPYTKVKGSPPSVTTVLGTINTPGLDWAAAKLTAEHAVYEEDWFGADPAQSVENLRRYFRGIWDGRAYMGTLTHAVMESWIAGTAVDVMDLVLAHKPWEQIADQKVAEAMGYIDGLERFWIEQKPTDLRSEDCIYTEGQYLGTRDIVCTINGQRWLLDIKTTAHQEADKGVYGDSWALQLAAYRYAHEVVTYGWTEDTTGKKPKVVMALKDREPNEPVDRCGVIHLRGDGRYSLYEIDADLDTYDIFLNVLQVHQWKKTCPKPTLMNREMTND